MSILARICTAPSDKDRLDEYREKFNGDDESYLYRVAKAIPTQKKVCERLKQIPRHRALVVVPQPKSNVVTLPTTGTEVPVQWRRPKLSIAR